MFNLKENFILFEPNCERIEKDDILMKGEEIQKVVEDAIEKLGEESNYPCMILTNRLAKIRNMITVCDNIDLVIMTKFQKKIWRKYTFMSQLGEVFLTKEKFQEFFPYMFKEEVLTGERNDDFRRIDHKI